jgi:hypothetical protein
MYSELNTSKDERISLQLLEDILEDFYKSLGSLRYKS